MNEQLDLFDVGHAERLDQRDRIAALAADWQRALKVRPDTGEHLPGRMVWCGRCGQTHNVFSGLHDSGWVGCTIDHDPTWSAYPRRPDGLGWRGHGVVGHAPDALLTVEEFCDRWDRQFFPDCICGHPKGLHFRIYGVTVAPSSNCYTYCGCKEYEAKGQGTDGNAR